jgi:hypothetical protein
MGVVRAVALVERCFAFPVSPILLEWRSPALDWHNVFDSHPLVRYAKRNVVVSVGDSSPIVHDDRAFEFGFGGFLTVFGDAVFAVPTAVEARLRADWTTLDCRKRASRTSE